ncbi:MAG: polyhydroxyalkanoate synthesis repressor PhaR [Rickettsiales bacterium]|nr:polyhydroxyalkanoate synthesis repressor PhaR [Rickettsiales bacterium]
MTNNTKKPDAVIIKKYANRRLYDTETSAYITLEDLCDRVKIGKDFVVLDAKTNQDLTSQVLTQIIFEQETKGNTLLPIEFLRTVIRFYDNRLHGVLQHYLDASVQTFMRNHENMQNAVGKAFEGMSPIVQFEEMTRQNVAFFEKAMTMFTPFGNYFGGEEAQQEEQRVATAKRSKR